MKRKRILGAAMGNCIHVGGLQHFLIFAESLGYYTKSLGPAVPVKRIIEAIKKERPNVLALSYRLTPEVAESLFEEFKHCWEEEGIKDITVIFGGTPPVARIAKQTGIFSQVFDGTETISEIREYLDGVSKETAANTYSDTLIKRIQQKYPYPILRHHFGRPSLEETIQGSRQIAESQVLDVLSIGPDQNAQEHFFHPEEMDSGLNGAGGVPLRKEKDLEEIYKATRTGNYPLLRCYSGTRDLIRWADMSVRTIQNAWAAIPLCWYNVVDGRSKRTIEESIYENLSTIKWYASRNIPVEVNESHQWSLRDAHDSLAVAMAYLAAYNAKVAGVRTYIAQFMFNTPAGTSASMDIAKMLAKNELIEDLIDENFSVIREVRAGIAHFSPNPDIAKGQLASSAVLSMAMKPHILHVVGFSESDHAVKPCELIESCNIIHGVLQDCLNSFPDITRDKDVLKRKNILKKEAKTLLSALKSPILGRSDDPWSDPLIIACAIKNGILDAPNFKGNTNLKGDITTRMMQGKCLAVDPESGKPIAEKTRTDALLNKMLTKNK